MKTSILISLIFLFGCLTSVAISGETAGKRHVYLDADQSEIKIVENDQLELHYYNNVRFEYKGADLYCDTAVWYESKDIIEFWGNIRYADSLHDLNSNYLRYLQAENRFLATGACELIEKDERVKIRGENVSFNRDTDELVVTDSSYLAVNYDDPAAIIEITSDTLHYSSEKRYGRAIDNVRIVKGSMVATCQRCEFYPDSNLIILEENPFAWQRKNELEGDTMYISLKDRRINQILVAGNGRALYRKEVIGKKFPGTDTMSTEKDTAYIHRDTSYTESRIEAKKITFFLEDEILSEIISAGNSYSWYVPAPEDTTAEGRNEASGDSILLFFDEGNLERVEIDNSCVGKFYSQMTNDSLGRIIYLDTVAYKSSRLYYNISERIINLVGNADVKNKSTTLNADTITYNTVTKDLRAYSITRIEEDDTVFVPVLLQDGTEDVTGERLVYNLETKRGKVKESDTELENAYYHGNIVRKSEEDVLLVDHGRYTTCDLKIPHYYFGSKNMKIINGDKVIAKPLILYIEGLPVFYAPFFVFSIKKGRHSGFLPFRVGTWASGDRYVDNLGYYWAISDYWDLETSMYLREDVGIGFNGTARYAKRYVMNGSIKGTYARDSRTNIYGRSITHRWSLSVNHSHTLSPTASISGNGYFVSDKSYTTDISNDINERLNRDIRSQLNFSKRWERSSLTAYVQSTKDLDNESSSLTLPSLSFRLLNSFTLFNPPEDAEKSDERWYHNIRLSYSSDFKNYYSKRKSGDDFSRTKYLRATHKTGISSPQNILKYITINPRLSYTESWFYIPPTELADEKGLRTDENLRSYKSSMSVSANTKLYGYLFPPIPGLIGIRHMMTPSASFSYHPKSDKNMKDARFVGAVYSSSISKSLSVSLSNLFQMKYRSGEQEKKLDLFTLRFSSGYNFEAKQHKWSNISTTLILRTSSVPLIRDLTIQATHDPYNPITGDFNPLKAKLKNVSISSGISLSGRGGMPSAMELEDRDMSHRRSPTASRPWSINASYRYSESRNLFTDYKSITHWITTHASFNLTKNWSVDFNQNYDIRRKLIVSRSINIVRDLHCWEAHFNWNPNGSLKGFYFKIFVKQIPDIKFEKEKSPLRGTLFD